MEELFRSISSWIALVLECLSVLTIVAGSIDALYRLAPAFRIRLGSHGARRAAWLSLARWLLLGLEFMLAADIVRTAIAPSWTDIGQLASIAVIRTFLNFFLERDLENAASEQASIRNANAPEELR
ncbi:DUF1622 domain-containing protein [Stenotrophomonas sp. SY1]|jgi:uncharacterized membrane protein|uniref:DUF1622 domain-containing protein n=1 Tax=Stenotrophomonas sp. SY1 TaxID=477235 RepID=UPI001E4BAF95|nr:DUF1622 domain-containing protein [Stenotrophomonas sp. SY1]MCD9087015.1 DUF1622 domain-containing protein [Stenotrophomonas sp. SY1]